MNFLKKILKLPELKRRLAEARRQGKKVAFTNGCFDLLHLGHVSYLASAKKSNHLLVVGLNSDVSVKKIKGRKRPISKQKERAGVLAALQSVDYVVLFDEDNPSRLIESVRPDVLIKGADWKGQEIAGSRFVRSRGGRVRHIKYLPGYSTTKIIEKIRARG